MKTFRLLISSVETHVPMRGNRDESPKLKIGIKLKTMKFEWNSTGNSTRNKRSHRKRIKITEYILQKWFNHRHTMWFFFCFPKRNYHNSFFFLFWSCIHGKCVILNMAMGWDYECDRNGVSLAHTATWRFDQFAMERTEYAKRLAVKKKQTLYNHIYCDWHYTFEWHNHSIKIAIKFHPKRIQSHSIPSTSIPHRFATKM